MARSLLSGTNIDPATTDYPDGRTRDKVGATPGTIPNETLNGDAQQAWMKLLRDAGITANGTPDNVTNGFQLIEALVAKIRATTSTTALPGTTEKATDVESLSGTANKNITADLIQSETALKAAVAVVLAGTVANKFITPVGLAARDGGLIRKVINIGDWNMDANETATVAHGVDYSKIVGCSVIIRNDADTQKLSLYGMKDIPSTPTGEGGQVVIDTSNIVLYRRLNGEFDSASYDSTGYNRGFIIIDYLQ